MNVSAILRMDCLVVIVLLFGCVAPPEERDISSGISIDEAQSILASAQAICIVREAGAGYVDYVYEVPDGRQIGLHVLSKKGIVSSIEVAERMPLSGKNTNGVYITKFFGVKSVSVKIRQAAEGVDSK